MPPIRRFALLCAALLALAAPLSAHRSAGMRLVGKVVDSESGAPIPDAVVQLPAQHLLARTDSSGLFAFPSVPEGSTPLVASRLGYVTLRQEVEIRAGEGLIVPLLVKPVVLEGLTVTADRLERRRRMAPVSVRALEREQLLAGAYASSVELAVRRLGINLCHPSEIRDRDCARVRGEQRSIALYIDDAPVVGGMDELEMYPTSDLYTMEWYPSVPMLRAYTVRYIEDLARNKRHLMPIIWQGLTAGTVGQGGAPVLFGRPRGGRPR